MTADLPRLTGPQWAALEAITARLPDAGPKPPRTHRDTLDKLRALGLVGVGQYRHPTAPALREGYGLTVRGQAALNAARADRLQLRRLRPDIQPAEVA